MLIVYADELFCKGKQLLFVPPSGKSANTPALPGGGVKNCVQTRAYERAPAALAGAAAERLIPSRR